MYYEDEDPSERSDGNEEEGGKIIIPAGAGNSPSEMFRSSGPSSRTLAPWSSPWAFLTSRFGPTWKACGRGTSDGLVLSPTPRRIEVQSTFAARYVVSLLVLSRSLGAGFVKVLLCSTGWLIRKTRGVVKTESRDCWLRRVRLRHRLETHRPCVPDLGVDVQCGAGGRPASTRGVGGVAPRGPRPVRAADALL